MKIVKEKKCKKCKTIKVIDDFYPQGREYFTTECKPCRINRSAEYDKTHIEQKRRRAREFERRKALKKKLKLNYECN